MTLSPEHGGAISACTYDGLDILRPTPPNWLLKPLMFETGYFPLVPYSNRIGFGKFKFDNKKIEIAPNYPGEPHPLHGFAWQEKWDVATSTNNYLALTMQFKAREGVWPWSIELIHTFRVQGNRLKFFLSAKNVDSSPMPIGLGFHPYFANYDKLSFQSDASHIQPVNKDKLPVSEELSALTDSLATVQKAADYPFDNCFTAGTAPPRIFWSDRPWHIEIETSDNLPFQVICSHPEGKSFCLEPVSHINNGLRYFSSDGETGIKVLQPNEIFSIEMSLSVVE